MTLHVLGNSNDKHTNERIKLMIVNIDSLGCAFFQPTYLTSDRILLHAKNDNL